jgi:hypothetical protein
MHYCEHPCFTIVWLMTIITNLMTNLRAHDVSISHNIDGHRLATKIFIGKLPAIRGVYMGDHQVGQ